MAFSNAYDTTNPGSAVSNREDLTDILTILAPQETPVLSSATKSKATATTHEWTVDGLSAPVATGIAEGADVTSFADKFSGRARIGNQIQTLRRDYMVSNIQNAVDSVGPAKIAQAEAKATREIKRDIEKTLMSANVKASENGAGTVNTMSGLDTYISSSGPADVPAAYRTPAASIHSSGDFTETVLNNLITSNFRVSGTSNSLMLVADTALRRIISDFARLSGSTDYTVRSVNSESSSKKITLGVEMYESDHGMVSVVNMNPDCAPDTTNKDYGFLLNTDFYGVADLIGLGSTRLPDLGGGQRGFVDWTGTLVVNHPGAHGKITVIA